MEKKNDLKEAIEKFKMEFFKALGIPRILDWLSERLK